MVKRGGRKHSQEMSRAFCLACCLRDCARSDSSLVEAGVKWGWLFHSLHAEKAEGMLSDVWHVFILKTMNKDLG